METGKLSQPRETGQQIKDLAAVPNARLRSKRVQAGQANLTAARIDSVEFTGCKLDYATLDHIRASGPVLFVHCSLREVEFTGCDLTGSLFDDCDLHLAKFGRGNYRGCDLRGNDLSVLDGHTGHSLHYRGHYRGCVKIAACRP